MKKTTMNSLIAVLSLLSVNAFASGDPDPRKCLTPFRELPNNCQEDYTVENDQGDVKHCKRIRVRFCVMWKEHMWSTSGDAYCRTRDLGRGVPVSFTWSEINPNLDKGKYWCTPYIQSVERVE